MHPESLVPSSAVLATEEGYRCRRKQACVSKEEYSVFGNQIFKSLKTLGAIQNGTHSADPEPRGLELRGST